MNTIEIIDARYNHDTKVVEFTIDVGFGGTSARVGGYVGHDAVLRITDFNNSTIETVALIATYLLTIATSVVAQIKETAARQKPTFKA